MNFMSNMDDKILEYMKKKDKVDSNTVSLKWDTRKEIMESKESLNEIYLSEQEYKEKTTKEFDDYIKAMQSYLDLNKINNETTRK